MLALGAIIGVGRAPAAPPKAPCVVSPSPVSLDLTPAWTVTAAGGAQGDLYEIRLRQGGVPRQDEGATIARVIPDAGGVVAATFDTIDYREYPVSNFNATLIPGTAKVTVVKARAGGGGGGPNGADTLASCSLIVTE